MQTNVLHVKLTRPTLVGDRIEPAGKVVAVHPKRAEHLQKSGAGVLVAPPAIEAATDPRPGSAERAVSARGAR